MDVDRTGIADGIVRFPAEIHLLTEKFTAFLSFPGFLSYCVFCVSINSKNASNSKPL